jgi:hypothetical protein
METIPASSTRPETIRGLTDRELERELTLATLTSRRQHRFDLLLSERHRRIRLAGDFTSRHHVGPARPAQDRRAVFTILPPM